MSANAPINAPIRHILAGTDLSPESRPALERAAQLAEAHGASLAVVHGLAAGALDRLREWLGAERVAAAMTAEAGRELDALIAEVRARHPVAIEAGVRTGRVPDELLASAEANRAELIVVGARGASRLRRIAFGSTAERLLSRSRVPVLVVRRADPEPYRRLLVPVDFSPWSDRAVRLARALAPDAHLFLLHAWQVPFESKLGSAGLDEAALAPYRVQVRDSARALLDALAATHGLGDRDWTPVLHHGEPWAAITEAEYAHDIDLVVIGKRGRDAVEELLLGSVTKGVLGSSSADVLVVTSL